MARVGVQLPADSLGCLVDRSIVGELLAALEDEVLEEMCHPVLLGALGARSGVERDERGDGTGAVELQAVDRKPVRGDGGGDRGHAPTIAPRAPDTPSQLARRGNPCKTACSRGLRLVANAVRTLLSGAEWP